MSKSNDAVLNRLRSIVEKMENDDEFLLKKKLEVFGEARDFQLCKIRQTDKDVYIKLEEENSSMPWDYNLEELRSIFYMIRHTWKSMSKNMPTKYPM